MSVWKEGAELENGTPSQIVLLLCFGLLLKVNKNLEKSEKKNLICESKGKRLVKEN